MTEKFGSVIEHIPTDYAKSGELTPLAKSSELSPLAKSGELSPLAKDATVAKETNATANKNEILQTINTKLVADATEIENYLNQ